MPTAYSYIRFSHPDQAKGDSLRRQDERTAAYCHRKGWTLDPHLTLRDLGVSAFRGKNAAVGNFRTFLEGIKTGKVVPGSVLIVESFDRISRQGIDEGYDLIKSILKAGIRIVTLSPEREFDREATRGLTKGALEIQLILERAAEESERKAERVGAAWREKKRKAAVDGKAITRMTPGWMKRDADGRAVIGPDGKFSLDPKKAASVRRVFALARSGLGIGLIAKTMNAERAPVLGRTSFRGRPLLWSVNVVYSVLTNRATYGEYQPHVGSRGPERRPSGDPIPNYYPAVITRDEYDAVRGLLSKRGKVGRGRRGKHVNLFAGLVKDARSGGGLTSKHGSTRAPSLMPIWSRTTFGTPWVSYLLEPFERALVSKLAEVKPDELAPITGPAYRIEVLTGQLAEVEALKEKWKAKMDNPDLVDTVAEKLADLGAKAKTIMAELDEARGEAASPIGEAWAQTRASGIDLKDDEHRLRYRTAIRRAIESVWVVLMPGQRYRVAAAQVWFQGGAHRDYVLCYHVKKDGFGKTELEEAACSFADAGSPGEIDLRCREQKPSADVAKVEQLLVRIAHDLANPEQAERKAPGSVAVRALTPKLRKASA